MNSILDNSLFCTQKKKYAELKSFTKKFSAVYAGNTIVKDSIFTVIQNYAQQNEMSLELMRFPMKDEELWAFSFEKEGTLFVCINTSLPFCKQFFAGAHELYHVCCCCEYQEHSYIRNGSVLDNETADENGNMQEDLEANAFAGMVLMPDQLLYEQIQLYGLDHRQMNRDSILLLMELFAMPFKAVVLRLYECGYITRSNAEELMNTDMSDILNRISVTGKAKHWQLDGRGTECFGSLFEKAEYNICHGYLTESREKEDSLYLSNLKKDFDMI